MNPNEVFRDIEIGKRIFQVSNLGRVYRDGIELRQRENHDGYLVVSTIPNRGMGVHRMVAMAFVINDDPVGKKEVNHIDFNRKNNQATNLEWLSHEDNIRHSTVNGRYIRRFGKDNPNFGNKKLSKFYQENPSIAVEKQSRKGLQNGKSQAIELYKEGTLIRTFDYIGACCEYLYRYHAFNKNPEVIRSGIRRSIKNNKPYKCFNFKKI